MIFFFLVYWNFTKNFQCFLINEKKKYLWTQSKKINLPFFSNEEYNLSQFLASSFLLFLLLLLDIKIIKMLWPLINLHNYVRCRYNYKHNLFNIFSLVKFYRFSSMFNLFLKILTPVKKLLWTCSIFCYRMQHHLIKKYFQQQMKEGFLYFDMWYF